MEIFYESRQEVPVAEACDVIVCGGGPAGAAAAVAAARAGARTRLFEMHGCLGGTWTSGLLSWILDVANKPGLMAEIIAECKRRGAYAPRGGTDFAYDVEAMKLLLEDLCGAAGVRLHYFTHVVAAVRGKDNRLALVVTESKSGRQAWRAAAFIDATGDGDLGAQAGCGYGLGREDTGQCQPMSLECHFIGVRAADIEPFIGGGQAEPKRRLLAEMARAGVEPSYHAPTIFRIRDDLFCLAANHQYKVLATDAAGITQATIEARAELHRLVEALRRLGPPWAEMRIVATGEQIGVREGRRIHGLYRVTIDDLVEGRSHEDGICNVRFPIDVHAVDPARSKGFDSAGKRARPYDVPLRALIAKDVDGLLMAGRCISGDFLAHSSYRVGGDAVTTGQAAGVTAALAAKSGRTPREVPWADVKAAIGQLAALPK